jgi:hypothetical protein
MLSEAEEETLQKKTLKPLAGALRPQTPHRSPQPAFAGNDNNQLPQDSTTTKKDLSAKPT